MDDEDTEEGFMALFDNCEYNTDNKVEEKIKPTYFPMHLPPSIIEILTKWETNNSSSKLNSRVGICPCDRLSLDGMFVHRWSESHVEQPSRLTSIINYLRNHFWIKEEIKLVHSEKFLEGFLSIEPRELVDDIPSMRTFSYVNAKYNFDSVGPIIGRVCRIVSGSPINLISSVIQDEIGFGFALVCPAGHHSSKGQVGTSCGFNSTSIGTIYTIQFLKLDRIIILDWDIHRIGGTQQMLGQLSNEVRNKVRLIDIYTLFGKISHSIETLLNVYLIDVFNKNQIPGVAA